MPSSHQENVIDTLIKSLSSLPGLGNRSARRIALHLLSNRHDVMPKLMQSLNNAVDNVTECDVCANLDMSQPCRICQSHNRDASQICVVGHVSDVWAIERTGSYKGLYHVLGGVLSAIDGIGPRELNIDSLITRIDSGHIKEVILALSATINGQSTAHYIADMIPNSDAIIITRLAHGVPVGGELDYLDDGTIVTAMNARRSA